MGMELSSSAFQADQEIPVRHTGDGHDVSPRLRWSSLPAGTKELALIVDDPDAPTEEPWVHWVLYKIPTTISGIPEGVKPEPRIEHPEPMLQGKNSWDTVGYRGPAPPAGHGIHHYHFKLYALDVELPEKPELEKSALLEAMDGHILSLAELVGTYQR